MIDMKLLLQLLLFLLVLKLGSIYYVVRYILKLRQLVQTQSCISSDGYCFTLTAQDNNHLRFWFRIFTHKVKSVMSGSGMSLSLLASSGGSSLEEGMGCLVRDSSGSNSVVSSC